MTTQISREERRRQLAALNVPDALIEKQLIDEGYNPPLTSTSPADVPPQVPQQPPADDSGFWDFLPWRGSDDPIPQQNAPDQGPLTIDQLIQMFDDSTLPGGPSGGPIDAGTYGHDSFTGRVDNIQNLLQELSDTPGGRRELFNQSLDRSSSFAGAPGYVQRFLGSRFNPLEAQYVTQGLTNPGSSGDFQGFLSSNPGTLEPNEWKSLFNSINDLAGSVQSEEDLIALGATPGGGGQNKVAYDILAEHGSNILKQAVSANVHPALATAARRELDRRFGDYSSAVQGAPSNQAEFVRQQAPLWESILGRR